jgi:hypothetical protein
MSTEFGTAHVMKFFDDASEGLSSCISKLVQDPAIIMERAKGLLRNDIADKLAYLDAPPTGTLPIAMFFSAIHLAVWLALKDEGVDVHEFGAAILSNRNELPTIMQDDTESGFENPGTHPWESDIEIVADSFNVKSCAEYSLYVKFDAMNLMPYMCASDDYDNSQPPGLRRTGTISLGHDYCDFRYREDGDRQTLAELFPDRIRWIDRAT